jgi:hypothetical protein
MPTLPGSTDQAVSALKKACDDAYGKYANSCSHAVCYVINQIADPKFGFLDANHVMDFLKSSSDWKQVKVDDGMTLANAGVVVVGGMKQTGHGHVIAIYPGEKIASGGYLYTRKDKKTGKDITEALRSHGRYPRALSTSIGSWPGALSKGDKTVWDPWADDTKFDQVTFWTKK